MVDIYYITDKLSTVMRLVSGIGLGASSNHLVVLIQYIYFLFEVPRFSFTAVENCHDLRLVSSSKNEASEVLYYVSFFNRNIIS